MIPAYGSTLAARGRTFTLGKDKRRLHRQFEALSRAMPAARPVTRRLLHDHMRLVRIPVAILLIFGGLFSFLPVLGIWMLPLGLMLLAVDVPVIRPTVSAGFIRIRRRVSVFWRQRIRSRKPAQTAKAP